jgi:hypothetical protein
VTLRSVDKLVDCDDPYGILAGMLTKEVLAKYDHNGVPPHELRLKVGDIVLVLVTMSKADKITKNTRVLILKITQRSVRAQTLTDPVKTFLFPRINFKFKLPYGNSFRLLRRQFPLRLAYAISINKAQGMEGDKIVIDARVSPFMMGHTYVATTRVTSFKNISILNNPEQIVDNAPTIVNVVYPELLTDHDKLVNPPVFTYDISSHSDKFQEQHKLCEAHIFNKLKFKANTPMEQAKILIVSIPYIKRQALYKMALMSTAGSNQEENQERVATLPTASNIINETLISSRPDHDPMTYYVVAAEPAVTINSPMCLRREQLERHMNLNQFTIQDVPTDGACFFHALLLEMQCLHYADIDVYTALSLRHETCDFLKQNTRLCCPVECPYLDLVVDPENYTSFDDFIAVMRLPSSYAEHVVIQAAHLRFQINFFIVHDLREQCTAITNDSYTHTVNLGNFENYHFVRAKPLITNTAYV